MYYTEFDWLSDAEIADVLPEDGVPESLVVQDLDAVPEPTGLTRDNFQDWLREGRHDCDAAKEMRRFWFYVRPGSSHDTEADFFDQLHAEFAETLPTLPILIVDDKLLQTLATTTRLARTCCP